jgi:hypothetical protein
MIDTRDTGPISLSGDAAAAGLDLFAHAAQAGRTLNAPILQTPCRLPADPPPEALSIAQVLALHIGRDHAITAPRIADAAGLWPDLRDDARGTRVREVITAWLEYIPLPGYVLVATDDGYFNTADPGDLTRQHESLRGRLRGLASRMYRLRLHAQSVGFVYHGHGQWTRP